LSCSTIGTQESSTGGSFASGSWGAIPTALQQVPSGGSLCGTTTRGDGGASNEDTEVVTTLWDQDLYNFYKPLVATAGCTAQPVSTTSTVSGILYNCTNGATGSIEASGTFNFVTLHYYPGQ
jgi:hypothetical protein